MKTIAVVPGALALAIANILFVPAYAADDATPAADQGQNATELPKVEVREHSQDDTRPKLQYIMKEVDGPLITVTKKTTVTKIDNIPTIVDNNLRDLFAQTPGLYYSEQQSPGQLNLSYRGIGNPQESEFVTVMLDGIPLEGDWVGFPTVYTFPLPQTLSQIQMIRGGSSLLYGPEPPPAINLISRKPVADREFSGYTENIAGSNGMFGTFNEVSGTKNSWDYLADINYRKDDGQRDNGKSELAGGDMHVGYRTDDSYTALDLHAYDLATGDPGKLNYAQFQQDADQTTTPFNKLWTDRYVLSLSHEQKFGADSELFAKVWYGYQDQASRSQDRGNPPTTATLQDEKFNFTGIDVRSVTHWGRGNAFTIGTTLYHSDAPFRQWEEDNLSPDRYDRFGDPCVAATQVNCEKFRQQRSSDYGAVFAENVFRLDNGWHIVPSVRIDHEKIDIDEQIHTPRPPDALIDRSVDHTVPLFGLGFGNDFGHANESYFNVSQGWRPVRYFDIGSPFGALDPNLNNPDPTHVLSWEAGVHGTPLAGLFYDASLFWVDVKDRIESQPAGPECASGQHDQRQHGQHAPSRFRRPVRLRFPRRERSAERAASVAVREPEPARSRIHLDAQSAGQGRQQARVLAGLSGACRRRVPRGQEAQARTLGGVGRQPVLPGFEPAGSDTGRDACDAGIHSGQGAVVHRRRFLRRLVGAAAGAPARRRAEPLRPQVLQPRLLERH